MTLIRGGESCYVGSGMGRYCFSFIDGQFYSVVVDPRENETYKRLIQETDIFNRLSEKTHADVNYIIDKNTKADEELAIRATNRVESGEVLGNSIFQEHLEMANGEYI